MKRHTPIFLYAALLALSTSTAHSRAAMIDTLPMDGFAAVVNERTITIGDVMLSVHQAQEQLRMRYSGDALSERREELFYAGLERQIDHALILEEFEVQEGQIPDRAVDDRVNTIIYENFNNDKPELLSALADDGVTLEEWRESIRENIIVGAMRQNEIIGRLVVSPKQIVDQYNASADRYQQPEQIRLRLIFIGMGNDPELAFSRIEEARSAILGGTPFSDVAKEVSEDATAASGGDWGWTQPGELREELREAISELPARKTSEPIYTPEGYYLLQVEEKKEAYTKSLDDVRTEIEQELREVESNRLYDEWMKRLRKKHSVLYFIPRPPDQS